VDAGSGEPTLAFEGSVGFLLSRAGALARRSWAAMLADHALTPHQYGVLMTIAEVGPVGQQQLSGLISVDPRNIVPVVDGLAERQLLARGVDPDDRRRRILTLTWSPTSPGPGRSWSGSSSAHSPATSRGTFSSCSPRCSARPEPPRARTYRWRWAR
jgi:MarR family